MSTGKLEPSKTTISDGYTNAFWNLWAPWSSGPLAVGATSSVAIEVLVSYPVCHGEEAKMGRVDIDAYLLTPVSRDAQLWRSI